MKNDLSKASAMVRYLNSLRNAGWNAIIGGSAIRDIYHDKPVSTVDILMKYNEKLVKEIDLDYKTIDWMQYWFVKFKCDVNKNDDIIYLGNYETYKNLDPHIYAIWHVITGGKKYQVIIINKDPEAYVKENYDFGICRAFCDGTKMHFTSEFLRDSLHKTITLYAEHLTPKQIEYALGDHIKSIHRKYPGWSLQK